MFDQRLRPKEGYFAGGFGMTYIDGNPHYSFHLFPEIAFSKIGIGLDLRLDFTPDGNLRTENFNELSDYVSIIRYIRYGMRNDPLYVRLGALDYSTLGHGSIMYLYNNSPTFDARRIGMEFNIDFSTFGIEGVWAVFGQAGVAGTRVYVRPLQFTSLRSIPIIGKVEIGATVANDFNDKAGVVSGTYDSNTDSFTPTLDKGNTTIAGADIELPIFRWKLAGLDIYFDYAHIFGFGHGTAAGLIFNLDGLGLVDVRTKFERRWNGDKYLPAYFNALYELERFNLDKSTGNVTSKIQALELGNNLGNGWYGELLVRLLGTFDILGSYQRLDDIPNSGILHLATDISPKGAPFVLRGGYDKRNIIDEGDLFKLDERSYLYAEAGYMPVPYLLVSIIYSWTFTPVRDKDKNILRYEPQRRVEPRISFVYPFNF
jgi:hypothetical protein